MMPTGKRGATVPGADSPELSAEEAEALAAEAEATAAAAAARAKVLKLRHEVEAAQSARVADKAVRAEDAEGSAELDDDVDKSADDADADDTDDEETPRRPLASIVKWASVVVAVIGIAALASTSAWILVRHQQAEQQRQLNADFSAAARQGVVTLMSLNFNNAQNDVQRIIDNSTGQFKEDFEAQSADFVKVAEESKVITDATVTATAVKTMTQDTADVLVSAYSTVTNDQGVKEDPRTWRLIVSMARDGGQLKVEKVEFAP